jgi:hypothetical protein
MVVSFKLETDEQILVDKVCAAPVLLSSLRANILESIC